MIASENLLTSFQVDAVNIAVYVLNKNGTNSVDKKSPYENWQEKVTNLSQFKVLGTNKGNGSYTQTEEKEVEQKG